MFKNPTKQKITSELKLLSMESPMTYDIEYPGLCMEQVELCGGVKPVIFVMCSKGCLNPSTFLYILFH